MTLTLQIKDDHRLLGEGDGQRRLESGTLTIGRGVENDWVLPDPERVISKQHCSIASVDDGYVLTDTSSNGVFVNSGSEPVGRGNSVPLHDGDQIRIAHFEFEASVLQAGDASGFLEPDTSSRSPEPAPDFSAPEPASAAIGQGDPYLDDLLGPGRSSGHPSEGGSLDEMLGPSGAVESSSPSLPEAEPFSIPDDSFTLGVLDDRPSDSPGGPSSAIEQIPMDQDSFAIPEAIPEDWLDVGRPPDEREPADEPAATVEPAPPTKLPVAPPAPPSPQPAQQVQPQPVATGPDAPGLDAPGLDEEFLRHFLKGAGLDALKIGDDQKREAAEVLGRIYREVVRGLMEILAARSSIKNEFRLAQTVIQPVENNPLKFSLNVDEAMTTLLTKSGSGYLPPVAAVQEAVDDLKAHQVAMLAGMQQALNGLLGRFDPAALEQRMAQDKGAGSLLAGKKARYWDAFTKLYEQIAAEAEDDFHSVFGREFGKAYEEQVQKQRRQRS